MKASIDPVWWQGRRAGKRAKQKGLTCFRAKARPATLRAGNTSRAPGRWFDGFMSAFDYRADLRALGKGQDGLRRRSRNGQADGRTGRDEGMKWVRTCQECGHKDEYKSPKEYKSDAWRDTKCRACGSMALDYGKEIKE